MKNASKIGGPLALVGAAVIWGLAFAVQREGMNHLPPTFFNAIRSFVGFLALVVVALAFREKGRTWKEQWTDRRLHWAGFCCGLALTLASLSQQWGLCIATAGKAAFLTALYIVFVPILGWILFHRRTSWILWLAMVLALEGMYLLCGTSGKLTMNQGDWCLLGCSVMYACHVLTIDHFVSSVDCVKMSCIQFFWTGVLSLLAVPILGECSAVTVDGLREGMKSVLFCGIFSSGIAFTLQIVGQKYVHPVAATLLMCLESVFGVIGGWLILGEKLSLRELCGCGIILGAVILAQLPGMLLNRREDGK